MESYRAGSQSRFRANYPRRPLSAKISGANFRSASVIAVGVVALFAGIILIVAFGVPNNVPEKPESISGTLVSILGLALIIAGSIYAYCQNRRKRRRQRARARLMKVRTLAQVAPAFRAKMFTKALTASVNKTQSSSPSAVSLVETVHASDTKRVHGLQGNNSDRLHDVF